MFPMNCLRYSKCTITPGLWPVHIRSNPLFVFTTINNSQSGELVTGLCSPKLLFIYHKSFSLKSTRKNFVGIQNSLWRWKNLTHLSAPNKNKPLTNLLELETNKQIIGFQKGSRIFKPWRSRNGWWGDISNKRYVRALHYYNWKREDRDIAIITNFLASLVSPQFFEVLSKCFAIEPTEASK